MKKQEKVGVKFRVPVSRLMYGMVVFFLVMTVVWTVVVDVVLLDQVISNFSFFLIFGVVMPVVWVLVFLFAVKCCFLVFMR